MHLLQGLRRLDSCPVYGTCEETVSQRQHTTAPITKINLEVLPLFNWSYLPEIQIRTAFTLNYLVDSVLSAFYLPNCIN